MRDLTMVLRQFRYEQLAFWRNRIGAVLTIVFSALFLLLLGSGPGQSRVKTLGGIKLVRYYVPGFAAYGVMAACFTTLCIAVVIRREMGLLKRLRLSPLPAWALIAAIFLSSTVIALIQVILMLAIGRIVFGVQLPGDPGAFFFAFLVGVVCFTAIGIAASTFVPNQDSAGPITSTVFFVFMFFSGLWFPLAPHSTLARVASWFPFRRMIDAFVKSFGAQPGASAWSWHDLGVLAIWGAVSAAVAVRRFTWSPRRA